MKPAQFCNECSLELTDENVDGLCPGCLLRTSLGDDPAKTLRPQGTNVHQETGLQKDTNAHVSPPAASDAATLAPGNHATRANSANPAKGTQNRVLGDYEIVDEIARGGMGVVYRARQKSLNRDVALKMILAGSLASEEDRIRFQTEAEAAAQLDHPGIVPIYEVGHEQTAEGIQYYYSMALIQGESLADRIQQEPFDNQTAAAMMIQICDAVEYAHQNGIVHRDLKPANILLDEKGRPRITDFGLAKNVDGDTQLTATGQVMGTPSYMPPEQVTGKSEQIGPQSDVYALGAIFYCMLTGKPPFQCETLLETLTQVLDREPESPSQLARDVDIDLETLCLKCLEKKIDDRFASVLEFKNELQRFIREEPIQSRRMSAWERIRRWRQMVRRNPDVRIQSKTRWFGLPLVSIAFGQDREKDEKTGTAKGIVAFGDKAFGVLAFGRKAYGLLAYGLHARGLVAIGFTSIGLFTAGFFSLGLIATGALAVGYRAFGCVAIGYTAVGLVVIGYKVAGAFGWSLAGR